MDMCLKSTEPLVTHVSDNTDYSSSSCPPSTNSEDFVSEGYLILSFDKKKKAVIKTAVFANVSDSCFADDFDEDNCPDVYNDTNEWIHNKQSTLLRDTSVDQSELGRESNRTTGSLIVSTGLNDSVKDNAESNSTYDSCYGEAVWVGEEANSNPEIGSNAKTRVMHTYPTGTSGVGGSGWESISQAQAQSQCLIRTSPLSNDSCLSSQPSSNDNLTTTSFANSLLHQKVSSLPTQLVRKHINNNNNSVSSYIRSRSLRTSYTRRSLMDMSNGFGDQSRKMLRCEECGKYYRNEYSLHHHICLKRKDVWKKGDVPSEMVDGQVIYFCPTCRKPFKWLGNLTRHFYVHTGQRFFRCDVCSKEFFSAYQVKRHMNSHTGIRFKCEVCEKPFTCKYACAWHTRQHYAYM